MAAAFILAFYERMGQQAYAQGKLDKAERWFRRLEAEEPDSLRVLSSLGLILLARGDAEGAERCILQAEKRYGPSFHRHTALADIAYAQGKAREARRRYGLALADPECAEDGPNRHLRPILQLRLDISSDASRFAKSRESMQRFAAASLHAKEGRFSEAVDLWREAASLDESNWPALNNAAQLLLEKLGRPDEAADLFRQAFELSRSLLVARNLQLATKAADKSGRPRHGA